MFTRSIVDGMACDKKLASAAVHRCIRRNGFFLERSRIGDKLEGRAWLIDIADGVVFQQVCCGVAKVIRIKRRPNGEGQYLAGVWVLDNDGAVFSVRALHVSVERLLGHELDIRVNAEDQVVSGQRITLFAAEHVAARVNRGQHAAGCTMQLVVKVLLKAAKPRVIEPDITEHLRGKLVVRIKALEFFLEVDTLQIERLDLCDDRGVLLACDPGEISGSIQPGENLLFGSEGI